MSPFTLAFALGGCGIFLAGLGVFLWALSLHLGHKSRPDEGRRLFGR